MSDTDLPDGPRRRGVRRSDGHRVDGDRSDGDVVRHVKAAGDREDLNGGRHAASSLIATAGEVDNAMFNADEIFQRVASTADHEFQRTPRMLWFSGMAAGLSIGLTWLARIALGSATGSPGELPGDLLYPVGFLVVVLGRYQLFTENTLTPITLVLARIASLPALLRLWVVVFTANALGAALAALLLSAPGALSVEVVDAGREIARHAFEMSVAQLFIRGVIAGGIVASMVWVAHAVRDSAARVAIIWVLMLMIPIADLFHCITGFCEVVFGWLHGEGSFGQAMVFLNAVAAGNTVGGVVLVAVINYGQTRDARVPDRDCDSLELDWREFVTGFHVGRIDSAVAPGRGRGVSQT